MSNIILDDITYGTTGWNGLAHANFEKIETYINNKLNSKGADVVSASALTLGAEGNYFDITGTTAITSIGTLNVGMFIVLHFDAILTLTHHATNLILPGGANIITAAGDEAMFEEYAVGDWRCVNYQKASGYAVKTELSEDVTPQLGGDLDTNTHKINKIKQLNTVENEARLLQTGDIFLNFVVTGLLPATSADLISDISAGKVYVTGTRVYKSEATSNTYTASVDTYVDISSAGVFAFPEVALGASAPAITPDSVRLAKVVTDADNITGVTDMRIFFGIADATLSGTPVVISTIVNGVTYYFKAYPTKS